MSLDESQEYSVLFVCICNFILQMFQIFQNSKCTKIKCLDCINIERNVPNS